MSTSSRLLPREHGAYAQLAFPVLTGLLLSWPSPAALLLAGAAVSFFLANEPLAILLGVRGVRLLDREGERARKRAGLLLAAGSVLGGLGVLLGWPVVWPEILPPAGAGLLLIPVVRAGRQKSLPGEILVLTAFSTLVLPLVAASGGDPVRALLATGVWWLSFLLATLEVHAIKARLKNRGPYRWTRFASPVSAGVLVVVAAWVALGQGRPVVQALGLDEGWRYLPPAAAALLPPAVAILALSMIRVHPRHLKRVGWTLVGANGLTLILLLQG